MYVYIQYLMDSSCFEFRPVRTHQHGSCRTIAHEDLLRQNQSASVTGRQWVMHIGLCDQFHIIKNLLKLMHLIFYCLLITIKSILVWMWRIIHSPFNFLFKSMCNFLFWIDANIQYSISVLYTLHNYIITYCALHTAQDTAHKTQHTLHITHYTLHITW